MPTYKLSYFNAKARAELARFLFFAAGKEFEDERLESEQWKAAKPNTPYGQLPILYVDQKPVNQSGAIARYLARELDMYGKGNMENTMCDVILETINDVWNDIIKHVFMEKDETKKAELGKKMKEDTFPKFLNFMTKLLKENGGQFFVGSKLSVADLAFFDMFEKITGNPAYGDAVFKGFPELLKHAQKVAALPNIKKWLDKRPKTEF